MISVTDERARIGVERRDNERLCTKDLSKGHTIKRVLPLAPGPIDRTSVNPAP
jgi:hypothetical protein